MTWRLAARGCLVLLLLGGACGRVADDEEHATGGEGGDVATGGRGSTGGALGSGGSGGKVQTGGAPSGGSPSTGGRSGTGGDIGTGGVKATGGTANTGGIAGGQGGVGGAPDYVSIGKSSWEVQMTVNLTRGVPTAPVTCRSADFTMHFEPKADGLSALSGRDGSVIPGELVLVSGPSPSYKGSAVSSLPSKGDCEVSSIQVSSIVLEGMDFDGDGTADEITGEGAGAALLIQGDLGVSAPLTFLLRGVPDTRGPSLLLPSKVHPLAGVRVLGTEPVALASKVTLKNGSTTVALDGYIASDGALGSFSSPIVLPFSSSWDVTVTGSDLAAHAFETGGLVPIDMLADPGLFAQDGFEGAPNVLLVGSAAIVSAVGSVPAISGSKSLFVSPTGSATLHLARSAGQNNVRFTAQAFGSSSGVTSGAPPVQVGAYFGSERVVPSAPTTISAAMQTGDTAWGYAGPKQTYTLTLNQSEGDVVVLIAPPDCFGFCPAPQAVLIDDLRVE